MMQRVYEIQSGWDERRKLRNFALRPPMTPSVPYKSPVYNPNLFSLFAAPSQDKTREMKNLNNGHTGYSFSQKMKNKQAELDPVENLKQQDEKDEKAKKLIEDDIDKKFEVIKREKHNVPKQVSEKSIDSVNSIKFTEKEKNLENKVKNNNSTDIENIHKKDNSNTIEKTSDLLLKEDEKKQSDNIKITEVNKKIEPELDYNSISDVIGKIFEKLNKKMDKWMILKMVEGKDKNQIMQLISFIKEHPDTVFPEEKKDISNDESQIKFSQQTKENVENHVKSDQNRDKDIGNEKDIEIVKDSPLSTEIKENGNNSKVDKNDLIYDQARFLSTNSETKIDNPSFNNVSNSNQISKKENQVNDKKHSSNLKEEFAFQDGPINLDIF